MLTRLFDFWKVKAWLDGHVEVTNQTNPNESIDTVYPADKTSFVPRCPKLYSLIVGDMVTLARGAQPIFSPHISVTIALNVVYYYGHWREPGAPCSRVACLSAREELRAGWAGWWQQPSPGGHSLTPGTGQWSPGSPSIFAELTTFLIFLRTVHKSFIKIYLRVNTKIAFILSWPIRGAQRSNIGFIKNKLL